MALRSDDVMLKSVSQAAGVDLVSLKNKYSSAQFHNPSPKKEAGERSVEEVERIAAANSRLDNYKICRTCQGAGTVKEVYNHQVKHKNCPDCDGESVVMSDFFKAEAARAGISLDPAEEGEKEIEKEKEKEKEEEVV